MTRWMFLAGTACLYIAAQLLWQGAEWAFTECLDAPVGVSAFWLMICGSLTVAACIMFAAFVANVIDLLAFLWREKTPANH